MAPPDWLDTTIPQSAAWAAVDLVLLDTFGHQFGQPVRPELPAVWLRQIRYSGVVPAGRIGLIAGLCLIYRMAGLKHIRSRWAQCMT